MLIVALPILGVIVAGIVLGGVVPGLTDRRRLARRKPSTFIPGGGVRHVSRRITVQNNSVSLRVRAYLALEQCDASGIQEIRNAIVGWTEPSLMDFIRPRSDPVELAVYLPNDTTTPPTVELACCLRHDLWMSLFIRRTQESLEDRLTDLGNYLQSEYHVNG